MATHSKKPKKDKAKKEKVNGMSVKSKNVELIFALHGDLVHMTVRQPKQENKKVIISAYDWMLINKSMFNPQGVTKEEQVPLKRSDA